MKLHELLALIKTKAQEMQNLVDASGEKMSDDDAKKFDELEAEVKTLKAQAKRLESVDALNGEFKPEDRRSEAQKPAVSARPRNHEEDARGGFENFAEFAMAVRATDPRHGASIDDRLKFLGAPSTTIHRESGSDDGYMVPPALKAEVFEVPTQDFNILPLIDSEPTSSNSVQMLADESTPWGSTGIQAYWGSEAGKMVRSKLETKGKDVKLHKLHAFVEITEELAEDAPRLNSRLTTGSNRAINWKLNESVFEGDGVGKPLGFENSSSRIIVPAESGQDAGSIVVRNLVNMYIRSTNPGGSFWLIHRTCLPELMELQIGDKPVWMPPNGVAAAPGGTLFGRPVYFSEHAEQVGTESDIRFVDPMGYYMPNRGSIKSSQSMHLLFDYDVQAFKWTFRAGGRPYLSTPISPNKGNSTQSSYIVLGARA